MDSTGFAGLAPLLADSYTVVTYDPRGITRSTCADPEQDVTPEILADDAHRLLTILDAAPASVFGSSGGAITGLALATRHPEQVHTLIAHEPPLIELLPDSTRHRAAIEDIYGTYRSDGPEAAMGRYFTATDIQSPTPRATPAPMHDDLDMFLGHMLRPITRYRPDLPALHTAPTHIVVAGGGNLPGATSPPDSPRAGRTTRHRPRHLPRRPCGLRRGTETIPANTAPTARRNKQVNSMTARVHGVIATPVEGADHRLKWQTFTGTLSPQRTGLLDLLGCGRATCHQTGQEVFVLPTDVQYVLSSIDHPVVRDLLTDLVDGLGHHAGQISRDRLAQRDHGRPTVWLRSPEPVHAHLAYAFRKSTSREAV